MLGKRLVRERLDPRPPVGRTSRVTRGGGGVADGEPGDAERHLLHGLQVVGDAVAGDLGGADQRGLDLGVQGEISGDYVHRLDEPGAGACHVEGDGRVAPVRLAMTSAAVAGSERVAGDPP